MDRTVTVMEEEIGQIAEDDYCDCPECCRNRRDANEGIYVYSACSLGNTVRSLAQYEDRGNHSPSRGSGACTTKEGIKKRTYLRRRNAKRAIKLGQSQPGGRDPMVAYRCEHCDFFHIGHRDTPRSTPPPSSPTSTTP